MTTIISGDGTITGLTSTGISAVQQLPVGSVLQVVNAFKGNIFNSTTTVTWTDVTGFSATITPKSATSNIFVVVNIGTTRGSDNSAIRLVRGSTAINIGDANGSYPNDTRASVSDLSSTDLNGTSQSFTYLDSPATTSATTYKIQFYLNSGTFYLNSGAQYSNNTTYRFLTASSITLMEIAA